MEKQNIYQFRLKIYQAIWFLHFKREESNDRKYSFKMWIDTAIKIWKRFTKNTKIKFRDHWISG
jgi:hypothetical protein